MKVREPEAAVGIDYGTTSSLAAVALPGQKPRIVLVPQRPDGPVLDHLPGYLYFPTARSAVVGEVARRFYPLKPHKVVRSIKRDLSRTWTIGRTTFSAGDLVRLVLREILAAVRPCVRQPVRRTVLTVPSTFGQEERRTMIDSAHRASRWLREVTLLDEPLAAFLAYLEEAGSGRCVPPPRTGRVLVFDMGGGTTDISLLEVEGDGRRSFKARVLGVWSDTRLGGDDFDTALAGHLAGVWMSRCPADRGPLTESERRYAGGNMVMAAEQAKIDLGAGDEAVRVRIDRLPGGPDLDTKVDHATYRLTMDALLGRVRETLRHGLERSGTDPGGVDVVVLAGGMSLSRIVQEEVESFFGRAPAVLADPVTAVVRGACLHHMDLVGDAPPVLLEPLRPVLTETMGLRLAKGRFLPVIEAGAELPARRTLHGCLLTPHTGCAAVRVPLYSDGATRGSGRRLLATLTLGADRTLPGGQPVGIEVEADTNKLIHVRAFLEDGSGTDRALEVRGL